MKRSEQMVILEILKVIRHQDLYPDAIIDRAKWINKIEESTYKLVDSMI
jgi:hypothetical protein